jgi:hypothetical protein
LSTVIIVRLNFGTVLFLGIIFKKSAGYFFFGLGMKQDNQKASAICDLGEL